jgi:multiple sugar transport system substrate-binding protein
MRRALYAVAIVAATLAPCGCGREHPERKVRVRLAFWTMWSGPEERNFLSVLRRYEETHPGIAIENLGAIRDDTKTVRAIVAGVPPDLFTLADPLYLGPLAANGALCSLDGWFTQSGLREDDFTHASLSQCRMAGRLYAMPYLVDCWALMWNKDAFREAGLDPEQPPRSLEELADYAVRLTKKRGDDITRLGLQPLSDLYIMNQAFGGRLYDAGKRRVTPTDARNIAALEWYRRLVERMGGYQQVNGFAAGFGQAQGTNNPFFVGQVAMMINGEWNPYWCSRYAPNLRYGVAPLPPLRAGDPSPPATWLGGNMICIPRGAKHPKEAWDVLVWMQSDEAQLMFADAMNNVPNQRRLLGSERLRVGADYRRKFSVFLDIADSPRGGHFPALPISGLYNNEMMTARDLVLAGVKTPSKAYDDVRIRVQRELDRYGE